MIRCEVVTGYTCLVVFRTVFRIDVKVAGFLSSDGNGRNCYTKGFTRDWVMDTGTINLELLTRKLKSETSWGSDQKVVFQVHDRRAGEDLLIESDSQLMEIIDMYKAEKTFMLHVYACPLLLCHHPKKDINLLHLM